MFKKKNQSKNLRKRTLDEVVLDDGASSVVKKAKTSSSINSYSTGKKKLTVDVTFDNSRTAMPLGLKDQGATRTSEIDEQKKEKNGKKKKDIFGPKQASSNIRVTCRFDYQPDICKDWKETGYCGYGDSCKFLHDRGDYKTGWQLDKEWEEKQKNASLGEEENYEIDEEDEDDLPFACFICRDDFKDPVVTHCEHYFCERCLLQELKKSHKCPLCSKQTNGIFKVAKILIAKMKEREAEEPQWDSE